MLRASQKVAVFIRTDVTKYKDLLALFGLASKEFGGVDVNVARVHIYRVLTREY